MYRKKEKVVFFEDFGEGGENGHHTVTRWLTKETEKLDVTRSSKLTHSEITDPPSREPSHGLVQNNSNLTVKTDDVIR